MPWSPSGYPDIIVSNISICGGLHLCPKEKVEFEDRRKEDEEEVLASRCEVV